MRFNLKYKWLQGPYSYTVVPYVPNPCSLLKLVKSYRTLGNITQRVYCEELNITSCWCLMFHRVVLQKLCSGKPSLPEYLWKMWIHDTHPCIAKSNLWCWVPEICVLTSPTSDFNAFLIENYCLWISQPLWSQTI